jgi:hypothetical protein
MGENILYKWNILYCVFQGVEKHSLIVQNKIFGPFHFELHRHKNP